MAAITVAASAARTANVDSAAAVPVWIGANWKRLLAVLDITASLTEAGDTLDVYLDVSPDGTKWINAIHFAQQAGNGAAKTETAILDPSNPGVDTVLVTSDCAAGKVRPAVFGKWARMRCTVVDGGGNANTSHTFSLKVHTN